MANSARGWVASPLPPRTVTSRRSRTACRPAPPGRELGDRASIAVSYVCAWEPLPSEMELAASEHTLRSSIAAESLTGALWKQLKQDPRSGKEPSCMTHPVTLATPRPSLYSSRWAPTPTPERSLPAEGEENDHPAEASSSAHGGRRLGPRLKSRASNPKRTRSRPKTIAHNSTARRIVGAR